MFDKFAEDHRIATAEIGDISVELSTTPLRDEEQERLDNLRKELDMERQKFTNAAIKFGKQKATLEVIFGWFIGKVQVLNYAILVSIRQRDFNSLTRNVLGRSNSCSPNSLQRLYPPRPFDPPRLLSTCSLKSCLTNPRIKVLIGSLRSLLVNLQSRIYASAKPEVVDAKLTASRDALSLLLLANQ